MTERWSAEDNAVVVTLPFDASGRDASATADSVSADVVATVNAVQAGEFGHSIPDGATNAGVRIEIHTGVVPLGPLAQRRVEILQERLGVSIPLSVRTDEAPPVPEVVEPEPVAAPAPVAVVAAPSVPVVEPAPPEPQPTAGLVAAAYVWDDEKEHLRAEIVYLGDDDADAQTQVDVRTLVELTIGALGSPATRAQIPAEAPAGHPVWLTVVVNEDAVGPLTEKMFEDGEDQFDGTRVDFVVVTEPRATIVEMLAQR
ncbi:hypothetical protein [Sanguibacter antarcticus]|uniref:hypothetical protein n=1 Tax=Sanguibacter antarcticus TaxID=372484 RepID=UPI00117AC030|nr:hypothetical protein [Sanguibacter antarcticus]